MRASAWFRTQQVRPCVSCSKRAAAAAHSGNGRVCGSQRANLAAPAREGAHNYWQFCGLTRHGRPARFEAREITGKVEAGVSIERNFMTKVARMLGALVCLAALCLELPACISPDLEPPGGGSRTSLPSAPRGAEHVAEDAREGAAADVSTKAADPAAAGAAAAATAGTAGAAAPTTATAPSRGDQPPSPDGAAGANAEADADAGVP